jgi:hypothetical protein
MNEIETEVCFPVVTLEPCDTDTKLIGVIEAEGHVATVNRLCELQERLEQTT